MCGGCHICRKKGTRKGTCPPLLVPGYDSGATGQGHRGEIVEAWPDPRQPGQQSEFVDNIELCFKKRTLNPVQLFCPECEFDSVLTLLDEMLIYNHRPYRVSPFDPNVLAAANAGKTKTVIFLHIGEFSEEMLKVSVRSKVAHLFCGVRDVYDQNDRHIKMSYDCQAWPSARAWLDQLT